jgi:asparagine synthase (glutamine-hydrolysing)
MCGIAGLVSGEPIDVLVMATERRLAALAHRGPDDAGILAFAPRETTAYTLDRGGHRESLAPPAAEPACANVVLGCRRLAIIDLSPSGHQPMVSTDGRYAIVLNGEIYNHVELRRELEGRGRRFRSRSDTEVLLTAFAEWDVACLPRLVGMFAFAILDLTARRLLLARDPFGIKPLYYVARNGTLAFASEIPPLLSAFSGDVRAHPQGVHDYLDNGVTDHSADTMYEGVQALPPAHYAVVDLTRSAELAPAPYWRPDLDQTLELSFDEAAIRLRDLFLESVALHLRSDVQVGVLLSGGVDSSSVTLAMRAVGGPQLDIHTFSYIGDRGARSEEPWIDIANRAAGAVPHKLQLHPAEWAGELGALLEAHGEPYRTPAVYAQYRLSRLARETGVKVLLSGQGSDELLAGYRYFWAARLVSLLRQGAPGKAVALLRQLSRARQPGDPSIRGTVLRGLAMALPTAWTRTALRASGRAYRPWINQGWGRRHGLPPRTPWWSGPRGRHALREALWLALTERSIPGQLRYQDRNSMAHSLEERVPFLTPRLAEFVLALPEEYLLAADGSSKAVFRAAMRGIVPDEILDRVDKVGFEVPIQAWLPELPGLDRLLDVATRLAPVASKEARTILERLRQSRSVARISFAQSLRDSTVGTHRTWWLAGLAAWSEQFGVRLD